MTGADRRNPQRFRDRRNPATQPLGEPSSFLGEHGRVAWAAFQHEVPWLGECHRALVEVACLVRGRMIAGEDVGVNQLDLLRRCLGQLGATPADMSKVDVGEAGEADDPLASYFSGAA